MKLYVINNWYVQCIFWSHNYCFNHTAFDYNCCCVVVIQSTNELRTHLGTFCKTIICQQGCCMLLSTHSGKLCTNIIVLAKVLYVSFKCSKVQCTYKQGTQNSFALKSVNYLTIYISTLGIRIPFFATQCISLLFSCQFSY